ncbi:MAG: molybdenum cofactor biosynthesis protein MoaE [Candidatus Thermoplasmatota archaeon]|nr:molybdenum cofactor biosynthesis protein MoaE [Candidatus Thermoplasmatota archaeon]
MIVKIQKEPIDVSSLMNSVRSNESGAVVTFQGTVRKFSEKTEVIRLFYESYIEMALSSMKSIAEEARTSFGLTDYAVVHRIGDVELGDDSVVVAVSSPHREEAFRSCKFIIDRIKKETPIWKKDISPEGQGLWQT